MATINDYFHAARHRLAIERGWQWGAEERAVWSEQQLAAVAETARQQVQAETERRATWREYALEHPVTTTLHGERRENDPDVAPDWW
jgi:hypothetical protein